MPLHPNRYKNSLLPNTEAAGFLEKGGPWGQEALDTPSTQDFLTFGGGASHAQQMVMGNAR